MRTKIMAVVTVLAVALTSVLAATPADAQWRSRQQHRGDSHHRGGSALGGFAAGAVLGGVLAAQRPYYYRPAPSYYAAPRYYDDDAVAYCMSRFRSYDPRSGTYLGYDGRRHACP